MNLIITAQQRDALLAYLVKRPFEEVATAVLWLERLPAAWLERLPAAPSPPPKEETKPD